jgi:hypothetical protein
MFWTIDTAPSPMDGDGFLKEMHMSTLKLGSVSAMTKTTNHGDVEDNGSTLIQIGAKCYLPLRFSGVGQDLRVDEYGEQFEVPCP